MMTWLISTALRQRLLVLALACVLIGVGLNSLRTTPLDVFPEFAPPLVEMQTEAPGLSTEEVESLITVPLENAVNGTSWLKTLRSKSVLGLSSVVCIFEEGTDLMRARQLVQERVAAVAPRLPAVAQRARAPLAALLHQPRAENRRLVENSVADGPLGARALDHPPAAHVRSRRGECGHLGPARPPVPGARRSGSARAPTASRSMPWSAPPAMPPRSPPAASSITPNQRLPVRHVSPIITPDDLARTVVNFTNGVPLRIGDVAEVVVGHPPPIGDAVINDGPGLLLIVEKQPWGNTLDVTRKVEAALEALKPGLNGRRDRSDHFPARHVHRALARTISATRCCSAARSWW